MWHRLTGMQLQQELKKVEAVIDTVVDTHHLGFNQAVERYSKIITLFNECKGQVCWLTCTLDVSMHVPTLVSFWITFWITWCFNEGGSPQEELHRSSEPYWRGQYEFEGAVAPVHGPAGVILPFPGCTLDSCDSQTSGRTVEISALEI
jgi:hypothetical protein